MMPKLGAACAVVFVLAVAASHGQSPRPADSMQVSPSPASGHSAMPQGQAGQTQGGCDPMCRGMMQKEMERARWMVPLGVVLATLATVALALLVVLEVLWIRLALRRLRAEPR